jgi:hypothetical protein
MFIHLFILKISHQFKQYLMKMKGKTIWGYKCKIEYLNQTFSTSCIGNWFFTIEGHLVLQKKHLLLIILFERIFDNKKLKYYTF